MRISYRWQQGEKGIQKVINLLQMSLVSLYLRGTKISCLLQAIQEGGFYLPTYLYLYYLCYEYSGLSSQYILYYCKNSSGKISEYKISNDQMSNDTVQMHYISTQVYKLELIVKKSRKIIIFKTDYLSQNRLTFNKILVLGGRE